MSKNTKLFSIIFLTTVILGFLLFRELDKAKKITTKAANEPVVSESTIPLKITDDPILGNPGAPVTVVEYLDLKNQRSKSLHYELSSFVNKSPQDVRLVLKHAPLSGIFSNGELAHKAAFCAGKQNKLWAFLDTLISSNSNIRESGLRKIATEIKLDVSRWWSCTNSEETKTAIESGMAEAQNLKMGNPPLIFLNNRKVNVSEDISLTQLLSTVIAK
jgi:protein-disulfide isomerase